ncbi:MAG: ATP synthase F1 subunit epsilon [Anaerolineales bacterium]
MPIQCEIVTQDKTLFEGEANIVVVPGTDGEMGILPHHTPLLTTLQLGVVRVRTTEGEQDFAIAGGVMEVRPEIVTILADVGERIGEIDIERAKAAKERAEKFLAEGPPPDTDEYLRMEAALRRSNLRLEAVRRYRGSSQRRGQPSGPAERADD